MLNEVRRPVDFDAGVEYQLVNAKRNRGGIVARERKLGRDIKVKSQFYVRAGDFLISKRQIVHGACGLVPIELDGAIVSNEYLVIQPTSALQASYLSYLSHTSYFQRTTFHSSIGVAVEKLVFKNDQWMRIWLPLPPLPEQRKITAILSSVDAVIAQTQAVIEQLKIVKMAMMQELLTRGIPRLHTRFKQTESGKIPEVWAVMTLDDTCRKITDGTHRSPPMAAEGYLYITSKNIRPFRLQIPKPLFVSEESHGEIFARCDVAKGDVLLTKDGANTGNAVMNPLDEPFSLLSSVAVLRTDEAKLLSAYLVQFLNSTVGREQTAGAMSGQAIRRLTLRQIKIMTLPLPPLAEQDKISRILGSVDELIEEERNVLAALGETKTSAISALLTGEVRVTPDEETT